MGLLSLRKGIECSIISICIILSFLWLSTLIGGHQTDQLNGTVPLFFRLVLLALTKDASKLGT